MGDVILPSLDAVAALIQRPKMLVSPMRWRPRLSRHEPQWLEFATAVEADGEVLEGVKVRFQWRPDVEVQPEKFNVSLFMADSRVYALDVDSAGRHLNKLGLAPGHPYENKRISGVHAHIWTMNGYGYAEPLAQQMGYTPELLWIEFCRQIAITPGVYIAPDAHGKIDQQSFL